MVGLTMHYERCTNKYAYNINLPYKRALHYALSDHVHANVNS
jgi:hypothetical protein